MRFNSSTKKSIDLAVPFIGVAITGYSFIGKNKDRDIRYIIFVMVLVGVALYALTSSITKFALEKVIDALPATDKADIVKETGIAGADFEAVNTASISIYKAFHASWDEDEDKAIEAVSGMRNADMVQALCAVYQRKFSLSLKGDFEEYCNYFDLLRVPALVKASWS